MASIGIQADETKVSTQEILGLIYLHASKAKNDFEISAEGKSQTDSSRVRDMLKNYPYKDLRKYGQEWYEDWHKKYNSKIEKMPSFKRHASVVLDYLLSRQRVQKEITFNECPLLKEIAEEREEAIKKRKEEAIKRTPKAPQHSAPKTSAETDASHFKYLTIPAETSSKAFYQRPAFWTGCAVVAIAILAAVTSVAAIAAKNGLAIPAVIGTWYAAAKAGSLAAIGIGIGIAATSVGVTAAGGYAAMKIADATKKNNSWSFFKSQTSTDEQTLFSKQEPLLSLDKV